MLNAFDELLIKPTPKPMDTYRFGTVTSTTPLLVRLDGDDDPLAASPVALASVVTADRVWVQLHGKQLIVQGSVTPPPEIVGAQNLNDYVKPGDFYQDKSADAATANNYPSGIAGHLEVKRSQGGYIYQWYWAYNASNAWTRSRYNGTWYAWRAL